MARREWTAPEDKLIRTLGATTTGHDLAAMLGRSEGSIRRYACRNKISLKRHNAWTWDETATLRRMAGKAGAKEIAATLGRTFHAVQSMALKLGLPLKRLGEHHHKAQIPDALRHKYWALVDSGVPKKRAALMVGAHPSTAQQWVRPKRDTPCQTSPSAA